jgi:hypothetical protein
MLDQMTSPSEAALAQTDAMKPPDRELLDALHILEQALAAATLAHLRILALLGLSPDGGELMLPASPQQAV